MAELGVLGDPMELEATLQQSGMTVSGLEAATVNIPSIQGYSVRVNDSQNRIPQAPGRGGAELSTSAHIAHGNPLVVPLLVTDKQHTSNGKYNFMFVNRSILSKGAIHIIRGHFSKGANPKPRGGKFHFE